MLTLLAKGELTQQQVLSSRSPSSHKQPACYERTRMACSTWHGRDVQVAAHSAPVCQPEAIHLTALWMQQDALQPCVHAQLAATLPEVVHHGLAQPDQAITPHVRQQVNGRKHHTLGHSIYLLLLATDNTIPAF